MSVYTLVGPAYPLRGGIAQYGSSLYLALSQRHCVRFIAYRRQYPSWLFPGTTQRDLSAKPLIVPNRPLLDPLWPPSWMRAVKAIQEAPPEALLIMWWNPFFSPMIAFIARRVRSRLHVPVVFFCHNVIPHEGTLIDRFLLRMAFSTGTHFLVQSRAEKEHLQKLRPAVPIKVIHHPCQGFFKKETAVGREAARSILIAKGVLPPVETAAANADSRRRRILLYFGHVRKYKGVDVLLQAMRLVVQQEDVELLLVGEFYEDRGKYERMICDLQLQRFVHVVDRYLPNEEVADYFEAADAVVLPYRSGTQSGVLPLAYEFERPAIVTRVGGIPEALEQEVTGLLVEPENPVALAGAILRFYREDLGSRFFPNLKPAARKMSWDALVAQLENFLHAGSVPVNTASGRTI